MTWETVLSELVKRPGVTMFLGASDTGKTTCLRSAAIHLARVFCLQVVSSSSFSFAYFGSTGSLVGLNDAANETLGLGLLEAVRGDGREIVILTPLRRLSRVRIMQWTNIPLAKTGEELGRAEPQFGNVSS